MATRIKEKYLNEAVPALQQKFGYKNPMQIPKLSKIVINMGLGDCKDNPKALEVAVKELAAIAGWVHDVGNSVNRHDHGPNGAILLFPLLREIGMDIEDVMIIITAVGNHEEQSGTISSAVSAALAIGDKSDAHKTRVRNGKPDPTDIHDRVNYSISENSVTVDRKARVIRHELVMDSTSSVLEYTQIYTPRIIMCEEAAAFLGCSFELVINGQTVNNRPTRQTNK